MQFWGYILQIKSKITVGTHRRNKINITNADFFARVICGALRDLEPFVLFKKREKHPCRSVTFSKVVG